MAVFRFPNALLAGLVLAGSVLLVATPALGQHTSEIGLGLGVTNYKGEISPQLQWQNSRPAGTVFYRRDISSPVTLRGSFTAGALRAADRNVKGVNGGVAPIPAYRQLTLTGSIVELAAAVEYNFLDYHLRKERRLVHATPYLFAGLAGYYASTTVRSENSALQADFNRQGGKFGVAIPAGGGVKVALGTHFNVGAEMGVRKTFTDQLDHTGDQDPLLVNAHDQDWYYYTGLSVSYTLYHIFCPPPYKHNKRLLR